MGARVLNSTPPVNAAAPLPTKPPPRLSGGFLSLLSVIAQDMASFLC